MIDEIRRILSEYETNTITKANYDQVMKVYKTNQEYFLLTEGKVADIEDCLATINEVPPSFDPKDKFFVGFWKDGNCVGVLDFLVEYPDQSCIWIGLLLIDGKLHRKQIGSKIVNAVLEASKIKGYASVQLGVVDTNIRGLKFWGKQGFEKTRASRVERKNKPDWNVIVMEERVSNV